MDKRQLAWRVFQRTSCALLILLATLTALYVVLRVSLAFGVELTGSPVTPWLAVNNTLLGVHIATGLPPLLLGFYCFSFAPQPGGRCHRAHRWIGTIYCASIWISAVTGLILAAANSRGLPAQLGFGCLAMAWFTTTLFAYRTARKKNFIAHRAWMIRSFALTLAVVAVRPLFLIAPPFGLTVDEWYRAVTWLCWVPNLLIAEAYIRCTLHTGRLALRHRSRASAPAGAGSAPRRALPA